MMDALREIYLQMHQNKCLKTLRVDIFYSLQDHQEGVQMLSPFCALFAVIDDVSYTITTASRNVAQIIQNTTAGYRKIRALKAEAELQIELNNQQLVSRRASPCSKLALERHSSEAALLRCLETSIPNSDNTFPTFEELAREIYSIERHLGVTDTEQLQEWVSDLTKKLTALKEKRVARGAGAAEETAE